MSRGQMKDTVSAILTLSVREKIIEMYSNRGITGRKLALVAAMTVGEKTMLEPEQKKNFIKAGVMHIMAVYFKTLYI